MTDHTPVTSSLSFNNACFRWCIIGIAIIVGLVIIFSYMMYISDTINTKHDGNGYKFRRTYLNLTKESADIILNKMEQDDIVVYCRRISMVTFYFTLFYQGDSIPADHVFMKSKMNPIPAPLKKYQPLYKALNMLDYPDSHWISNVGKIDPKIVTLWMYSKYK